MATVAGCEKAYWMDMPQHTIDYANKVCAENRERIRKEQLKAIALGSKISAMDDIKTVENNNGDSD